MIPPVSNECQATAMSKTTQGPASRPAALRGLKKKAAVSRTATDARSVRSRKIVLEAALALFARHGYAGFSVNEIVRKTGVAKTTIYRHWSTQSHLLTDVIAHLSERFEIPDRGSLRQDLAEVYRRSPGSVFHDHAIHGISALIAEATHEPGVARLIDFMASKALDVLRTLLERGKARGEVRADRDVETMAYILFGALNIRRLFLNKDTTEEQIAEIIDVVMEGIRPLP